MGLAVEVQVEDHFYLQQEHCLWWRFWTRAPKECHDVELEGLGHPGNLISHTKAVIREFTTRLILRFVFIILRPTRPLLRRLIRKWPSGIPGQCRVRSGVDDTSRRWRIGRRGRFTMAGPRVPRMSRRLPLSWTSRDIVCTMGPSVEGRTCGRGRRWSMRWLNRETPWSSWYEIASLYLTTRWPLIYSWTVA